MYLFSGLAKMQGNSWQMGTAVWWAAASYEYQSIDLTWLAGWPMLVALLTHATVFWETFYCCLVWNRFTRPLVLWMAVAVHGGIAPVPGHDHLRPGDDLRQPGVPEAGDGAALDRPRRQPRLAGARRAESGLIGGDFCRLRIPLPAHRLVLQFLLCRPVKQAYKVLGRLRRARSLPAFRDARQFVRTLPTSLTQRRLT